MVHEVRNVAEGCSAQVGWMSARVFFLLFLSCASVPVGAAHCSTGFGLSSPGGLKELSILGCCIHGAS